MATKGEKGRPVDPRGRKQRPAVPQDSAPASAPASPSAKRQAARVALLGPMAAGIAHEFNNLLTIVLGSLEQLQRQPLDAQGQKQLRRVEWGVQQAGKLTQQILSLVRPTDRSAGIVDLNAAVTSLQDVLRVAAGKNIQLRIREAPEALPAKIDPGLLGLALVNLVRNAADAIEGNGTITISLTPSRTDKDWLEVAVADTGSGMPPQIRDRATASFFTTKRPGHGTGLGLWMVKRLMTSYGGQISIETAVGRGTTVRLLFPRSDDSGVGPANERLPI